MNDDSKYRASLPADQKAILAKCFHPNGVFVEFTSDEVEQSIPERFESVVADHPDRTAVKVRNHQLTYDALNKAANRVAHTILNQRALNPEPVVVFLEADIPLSIASLAVFKAGKFTFHINPLRPETRIERELNESRAAVILTDDQSVSRARRWLAPDRLLINIDHLESNISEGNPNVRLAPDAYAYVNYTSGSTAQSKGLLKTHRYVLKGVRNFMNAGHICAEDRLVLLGRNAIVNDLLTGATLYPINIFHNGLSGLADWLRTENITVYRSFPTAFRHFMNTVAGDETFPTLRLIRLGGEPLYRKDVDSYQKHFSSGCILVHSYGSTETGAISHYYIDMESNLPGARVPVGYPLEGMEVFVCDEQGRPLKANQIGEIAVKSRLLASGYWPISEATRENFFAGPASGGERTYRTGDLGRISPTGCLENLGRKDSRVKIRSFRVDVGELEATLVEHSGVKEATVIAKVNQLGDKTLIAYFVPKCYPMPTVTSLRDFLLETLPDYMIPTAFVALDDLPVTATGKIDRRALPDFDGSRPNLKTPYAPPVTPVQTQLSQIWVRILSINHVGIHDNFFDLGGHSLAATRVVSQVLKEFQIELPLQLLFQSPTIAEMATVITEHQGKKLGGPELQKILSELESLSDEDARGLLASQRSAKDGGN